MGFPGTPRMEVLPPDPEGRAGMQSLERNSRWLEAHWADLLPQARGKFLAVASGEAFVADTAKDAWDWAARVHPEDKGPLVEFVSPATGPRFHALQR